MKKPALLRQLIGDPQPGQEQRSRRAGSGCQPAGSQAPSADNQAPSAGRRVPPAGTSDAHRDTRERSTSSWAPVDGTPVPSAVPRRRYAGADGLQGGTRVPASVPRGSATGARGSSAGARGPPAGTQVPHAISWVPPTCPDVPPRATHVRAAASQVRSAIPQVPQTATQAPPACSRVPPSASRAPGSASWTPACQPQVPASGPRLPPSGPRLSISGTYLPDADSYLASTTWQVPPAPVEVPRVELEAIMTSVSSVAYPRGVFGTGKKNVPRVLSRARVMHKGLVDNPGLFPSPPLSAADFLDLITDTDDAQTAKASRAAGLAAVRNGKRNALWTGMQALRVYYQGLADKLDAMSAIALLEAAGLVLANSSGHGKALLQALLGSLPGLVHLVANASILTRRSRRKAGFNWQWSADNGVTWTSAPSSPYADTEIGPLAPGAYLFRVCVTLGRVTGEWTAPVDLTIHP
jgi:hypothetical protein